MNRLKISYVKFREQNKYFTYEMESSQMKINITNEILILPMELKQLAYEIIFS